MPAAPQSLHIHHVLDTLQVGGAETLVVTMAALQQQQGHRVHVHGLFGGGPLTARLVRAGVPFTVHDCGGTFSAFRRLWSVFRAARPDVAHLHNLTQTIAGAPAARLAGVPSVISTRHGPSTHSARRERKFWLAARACRHVVAVSEAARLSFLEDPWTLRDRLAVVLNGAARPVTLPAGDLPAAKPGPVVLAVGRFTWEKDFPSLVRAFAAVRPAVPDAQLWICGDGGERPRIEAEIASNALAGSVRLLGLRQDVGYWLSLADVFALSSVSEGLPVSLLEAMALGVPIVATSAGGVPEVVKSSNAGLIVPRSQPDQLAAALTSMLLDSELRARCGASARSAYETNFTLERMAARYLTLYRETP